MPAPAGIAEGAYGMTVINDSVVRIIQNSRENVGSKWANPVFDCFDLKFEIENCS